MRRLVKDAIDDSRKIFKDMGMNKWREVAMSALRKGDRFRIYTKAGRPLELGGEETLIADSNAYQVNGIWTIEVNAR